MRLHLQYAFALSLLLIGNSGFSADYARGFAAYSEGDYATALAEWQPLADAGDANGQFGLGLLYANGWGVDLNDDEALKWYRLAAGQGHAEAAYNLGVMNANGWGVPQSDEQAFKWYSMAAARGFTTAQVSLGKMYAIGYGAPLDLVRAHMWYSVAAALGDYNAEFERDELARTMSPDDLVKSEQLALAWHTDFSTSQEQ
ncbi:MAG: tetratricopeptide repeat protein [Planctomycetota bacterium]|jgi:TPR repeat protein